MRGWILGVSVMTLVAGCADLSGTSADSTGSSTAAQTSSGPATTNSGATATASTPPNAPPAATLSAENVTGALPLNVTFSLNGTDPEGGALSWTLQLGDGSENVTGTALPATANHTYAAAGNFTALLEVSDGTSTVNATVAVNVTAALAGAGPQTHVISGSTLIPFPPGDLLVCIGGDVDGNVYDLAPAAPAWSYVLEPSDGSFGIYWYKGGSYQDTGTPTGTVPDDMDQVEICNIGAVPMSSYTLTLTSP